MTSDTKISKDGFVLAVTGASGSIYAEKFLGEIVKREDHVHVVFSETGEKVARYELAEEARPEWSLIELLNRRNPDPNKVKLHKHDDFFACLASGSSAPKKMLVAPCSMGTAARIAGGFSTNLIERTADVMLKERHPLVICPRETPFSAVHLENLAKLDRVGAHIVPAMPGFYQRPQSREDLINFVVGKLLEAFSYEHDLYPAWKS